MRCLLLLTLVLAFLLCSDLAVVHANEGPHQIVVQHFNLERNSSTPLVEVRFSNAKTGLFAIDTGAYECVMSPAWAKRLGLKQSDDAADTGNLPAASTVHVTDMRIDQLRVTDITFKVAADNDLGEDNGRPIDGLIGGNLLSRFALLLDYPRHTLVWIYPGDLSDTAVTDLGLDPAGVINLHQESHFEFDLKINHYSTSVHLQSGLEKCDNEMYFDTGAPVSTLSSKAARRLTLSPTGPLPLKFVFQAPCLGSTAIVPQFEFGSLSFSNVFVVYPSHPNDDMVSLIGANVLSGCVALFDFGPHRCYLKPMLPGLTPASLPAIDTSKVDWDRLRNAPDLPGFPDLIHAIRTPDVLECPAALAARLRAQTNCDAECYEQIGALLHRIDDQAGSKSAYDQAIALCRADAEASSAGPAQAAKWTEALIQAGRDEDALDTAERSAARWPQSPIAWQSLGQAQENRAGCLLFGKWSRRVTDDEALEPFPSLDALPEKPDPAQAQRIAAFRLQARKSYGQAILLAPQNAEGYHCRAQFWCLEGWLLSVMYALDVGGQAPSTESAAAGEFSDYQNEVRLSADNIAVLRRAALMDAELPAFHNSTWLRENLHATGQGMGMKDSALANAKSVQERLAALSSSLDKKQAISALAALGEVETAQDDPAGEATLRKALALDPSQANALASLATLLVAQNRLSDLRDLLTQQVAADDTPGTRLLLSVTLSELSQPQAAEQQARFALKFQPDGPTANLALAALLLSRSASDYQLLPEAAACLTKAETGLGSAATETQNESLQTMQAVWLALTSDPAGARRKLIDLLQAHPVCTQAREALYALALPPSAP